MMRESVDPTDGPMKQQFNVYLPPALIRRIKYRALDDQTSLSELVERILTQFINQGEQR
jgi:predicted HicB family RNase H-like nuclease